MLALPLAVAISATAWGHSRREPVRVEVPFETSGHDLIVVRISVAGRAANFILDTGDELTMVDRQFAGFPKQDRKKSDAPGGHGVLTTGMAQLPTLCFESYCLKNRKVGVGEFEEVSKLVGRRIDGTIGQDLLREFDEVIINYKKSTVTLSREGQ